MSIEVFISLVPTIGGQHICAVAPSALWIKIGQRRISNERIPLKYLRQAETMEVLAKIQET